MNSMGKRRNGPKMLVWGVMLGLLFWTGFFVAVVAAP